MSNPPGFERVKVAPPRPIRRAVVKLSSQVLGQLIGLPDGLSIIDIRPDLVVDGLAILVEGDQLAESPPDAVYPDLPPGGWYRCTFIDEDGKRWARFEWEQGDG